MKKYLSVLLTITPLFAPAQEMTLASHVRGLPDDFKRYFYDSELIVQVYLNDTALFDAAISLEENGEIRLIRIVDTSYQADDVDPEIKARWADVLKQGVSVGQCTQNCPSGLMAVEYRLDNSVLKLYTSQYEKGLVKTDFISLPKDMPGGVMMYNRVSARGTSHKERSWGINSTLKSSFAGWSQNASFYSSGTGEGHHRKSSSSLYQLFSQKELQGSFVRLGLFTPSSDSSNVQTSGFGDHSVVGAMWGTSDTLLIRQDSVSAFPVYITGRNQSIAEVWQNEKLIYTQQLQSGIQALDTRQLPNGIYDITIKIIENGQTVDTQKAQIYKPQGWNDPDKRWRLNFWGGQRRTFGTSWHHEQKNNPFTVGGEVDILAHPRAIVGLSGALAEKETHVGTRANITISENDRLFTQYTLSNTQEHLSKNTTIHYYRKIPIGSAGLYWRSTNKKYHDQQTRSRERQHTWGTNLSLRLPWSTSLMLSAEYVDRIQNKGFGADISLSKSTQISGHNTNFRLSGYHRPGFQKKERDQGVSFGVSIALAPANRHRISAETGLNQHQNYSSLNYQWQPGDDDNPIRTLGAGVSQSSRNTIISTNGAIEARYLSGNVYTQHHIQGSSHTVGGNLSQLFVLGGGKVGAANGNNRIESALIVDVDADDDSTSILASGNMGEKRLFKGKNIVPIQLWEKNSIQFTARGGEGVQVFPEHHSVQMNRGSVKYLKVKAMKTFTLVGMLKDEQGNLLKNRYVSSDVAGAMINADGVLTLDAGVSNRLLTVTEKEGRPKMQCALPSEMDKKKQIHFINTVLCKAVSVGEEKS